MPLTFDSLLFYFSIVSFLISIIINYYYLFIFSKQPLPVIRLSGNGPV